MLSLLIDTSTEHGVAVFFEGDRILFSGNIPVGLQNSKLIMGEIERGLKELNIKVNELQFIAVAVGPGSYTGIRVGVITAKALAYPSKIPVVAFSSLDGFVPDRDGTFLSIIDAKIGGAYFQKGEKKAGSVSWSSAPAVSELGDIKDLEEVDFLVCPNSKLLQKKVGSIHPEHAFKWIDTPPNEAYLVALATEKFERGDYSIDGEVDLLYLRKTQAEIERENL